MPRTTSPALHVAFDPLFSEHHSRGYHPERPARLDAARRGVDALTREGVKLLELAPRDVTREELARVHDDAYIASIEVLRGHETALDADTYVSPRSVDAAFRAAGAAVALVEALLAPEGPRQGVALLRPPGHHATRDQAMGFCLFNNVAVAAASAIARGLSRVAIVDFDVHHGNGTQDIFWRDPNVLFVSLHEAPLYPGTGAMTEVGEGPGLGLTVNVPLPAAGDNACYRAAFEAVVVPAVRAFEPELVLISAGFDAHARDPLASMEVTEPGYAWMGRALRELADVSAGGRVGVVLEGGYDLSAIEHSMTATLRGVLGFDVPAPEGSVSEAYRKMLEGALVLHEQACGRST